MVLNLGMEENLFKNSKEEDVGISAKNIERISFDSKTLNTGVTKTTTTYTTLISKTHRSITGKMIIMAIAPILATGSWADVSIRLTKGDVLIPGSEMLNLWCEGDGARVFTTIGFTEANVDELITYALQWKQGDFEENIVTGTSFGNYTITIQDIGL